MTNKETADDLFERATDLFCAELQLAAKITDESKRLAAFQKIRETYDLQREYQRKIRCGERA